MYEQVFCSLYLTAMKPEYFTLLLIIFKVINLLTYNTTNYIIFHPPKKMLSLLQTSAAYNLLHFVFFSTALQPIVGLYLQPSSGV